MKKKPKDTDEDGNRVSKPKKKPSTRKKRISARLKKMALKYEAALQKCTEGLSPWKIEAIKEDPLGRHGRPFYREVALLAESKGFEPKRAIYAGKADPTSDDVFPEMITGKKSPDDDDNCLLQ